MSNDLISRQAAIDEIEQHKIAVLGEREWHKGIAWGYAAAHRHLVDVIKQLPSAQPEIIRCEDCKHYLNGGCGNVDSQSPSKKLIDVKPDWYCADGERREE